MALWRGSYLNRVEQQNGMQGRAESNLFISSTMFGSNMTDGKLDNKKHQANMLGAANFLKVGRLPPA